MLICAQCEFANRDGVQFCEQCGHGFESTCSVCGDLGPATRRFCGQCGCRLADDDQPGSGTQPPNRPLADDNRKHLGGERRNLTVMFCDLVGSTVIAQKVDAEDMTDIIRAFTQTASDLSRQYGGHVARFLGDAVLCYFGYPKAFEDSAQRGLRAALDIVDATPRIAVANGITLHCRVGLAYGDVVTGETIATDFGSETIAIGNTPNLAARLQGIAEQDTVIVSDTIRSLARNEFTFADAGWHELKGYSTAQRVWQVTGRLDRALSDQRGSGHDNRQHLVGREEELALLTQRWTRSINANGQLVHLCGQPGIGKTRLTSAFKDYAAGDGERAGAEVIHMACFALEQHSALHPVVNYFKQSSAATSPDQQADNVAQLARIADQIDTGYPHNRAAFASLLGVEIVSGDAPETVTPREKKQRIFTTLNHWIRALARRQPVLLVIEDIQWADPTTLEWISECIDFIGRQSIMLLVTSRPEFTPTWRQREHCVQIYLEALTTQATASIVSAITGGKPFPREVMHLINERTEGVPLYVEAFTQAILAGGNLKDAGDRYAMTGPLPAVGVPATLQDSLMARLDRDPRSRQIAQIASVIGREFMVLLLERIAKDKSVVETALKRLHDTDLAVPNSATMVDTWMFKHALIRDTAYNSMLRARRKDLHALVAEALTILQPTLLESRPEILAHHWSEAERFERSVPLWQAAAEQARDLWANREAVEHYRRAIVDTQAGTQQLLTAEETQHKLLALHLALGDACRAAFGSSDRSTKAAYADAVRQCDEIDGKRSSASEERGGRVQPSDVNRVHAHSIQRIHANYGAFIASFTAAELDEAESIAQRLKTIADGDDVAQAGIAAAQALGMHAFATGQLEQAKRYLSSALTAELTVFDDGLDIQYPALSQCYLSWTLHILGDTQAALEMCDASIDEARRGAPYSLALTLANSCYLHQFRGDTARIRTTVEELHAIAREKALPAWEAVAEFFDSYAACHVDQAPNDDQVTLESINRLSAALSLWSEDEIETPYFKTLVAEVLLRHQQTEAGLALLREAGALMDKTGECWYRPQLEKISLAARRLDRRQQQRSHR